MRRRSLLVAIVGVAFVWLLGNEFKVGARPETSFERENYRNDEQFDSNRFVRNPSVNVDFFIAVHRMQMLAKVTNGIALQRRINSETANFEEIVSELLRLGPLTPTRISQLDEKMIGDALEAMKKVSADVQQTENSQRIEKFYRATAQLRKAVVGLGDITEWSAKDDFERDVGELSRTGLNTTLFVDMSKKIASWDIQMKILSASKTADRSHQLALATLYTCYNTIVEDMPTVSSILTSFQSVGRFKDAFSVIERSATAITFTDQTKMETQLYFNSNRYQDKESLEKNFQALLGASSIIHPRLADFEAIAGLANSRKSIGTSATLKHTVGFPEGVEDLQQIDTIITDQWMGKAIGPIGLWSLKRIFFALKSVYDNLDVSNERALLLEIIGTAKKLVDFSSSSEKINFAALHFFNCSINFVADDSNPAQIEKVRAEVKKLDAVVLRLKTIIDDMIKKMTPENMILLKNVGAKFNESSYMVGQELKNAIQEALKSDETKKANEIVAEIEDALKKIEAENSKAKDAASSIAGQFQVIEAYRGDLGVYSKFFNCLQTPDVDINLVLDAIDLLEKFRTVQQRPLDIFESTVKKLKSIDFQALNNTFSSRKSDATEAKLMQNMIHVEKYSETIGKATEGVVKMRKIIENPLMFENEWFEFVESELAKSIQLAQEDKDNLMKIKDIQPAVESLNIELNKCKDNVRLHNSTKLENLAALFIEIKNVTGINMDFDKIRRSVERLEKATQGVRKRAVVVDAKKLQSKIDELGHFGLDFASYATSFGGAPDVLKKLDKMFADYSSSPLLQEPTTPTRPPRPTPITRAPEKKPLIIPDWLVYTASAIVFCLLFLLMATY